MNYKGYEITTKQIAGKWDGKAVYPGLSHRTLVTMCNSTPEEARAKLKASIDFWLRPLIDVSEEELLQIVRREEISDAES